uniref:F-box domain-containing protein n=1 Tax=Meloidogyne hapla TaxID=6305 RepID=A0A1I8B1M5_MELHA
MYFLPTETKLDIFKYLNFDQLFSIKQTNLYFRDFINKYEGELARMELFDISIVDINKFKPMACKLIKPKTGDFNFPLDDELEEKWENGLEEPIRLYLHNYDFDSDFVVCLSKEG